VNNSGKIVKWLPALLYTDRLKAKAENSSR